MNVVCIAPFGDYVPGDVVEVPDGSSVSAAFFAPRDLAPADAPAADPGAIVPPVA
jgi:hypothetical protein